MGQTQHTVNDNISLLAWECLLSIVLPDELKEGDLDLCNLSQHKWKLQDSWIFGL